MRLIYAILLFVVAALCACKGCKKEEGIDAIDPPPQVVNLDEGTGSSNEEPLWRLSPGMRIGESAWVLPPVEVEGRQVLPLASTQRGPAEEFAAPNEPGWWMYLTQDGDGNVWYHGAPREGMLDDPALFVPAEVRLGMRWNTGFYPGGDYYNFPEKLACTNRSPDVPESHSCSEYPRFTVEVTDARQMDTIYGTRMVWTLTYSDWRRYIPDYMFPGYPDEEIWDGVPFTVRYVEGRGPIDLPGILHQALETGVVPLEDYEAPAPLPVITLTGGEVVSPDGGISMGRKASAYIDPNRESSKPLIVSHGIRLGVAQAIDPEGGSSPIWTPVGADLCFQDGEPTDECNSGNGVFVASDGERALGIDVTEGGIRTPGSFMQGLFEGPDGTIWGAGKAIQNRTISGRPIGSPYGELAVGPVADDANFAGTNNPFMHLWLRGNIEGRPYPEETLWMELKDDTLRILEDTHRLDFYAWDWTERRPRFEGFQYPAVMDVNVTANPGGKVMLLTTFQGRVDRVHLREDGIEIQPIGDVELPEGHFLTGAVLVDDELIAFTQKSYTGIDIWFDLGFACDDCTGLERRTPPQLGTMHMWRAELPSPGETKRPGPQWGVTATATGLDVRVCWPGGYSAPSLDGWTLGGHHPRSVVMVGDEDRCVLLTRDLGIPDLLTDHSSWVVEGPLPGYGRVAIGTGRRSLQDSDCGRFGCAHEFDEQARLAPALEGINHDMGVGGAYPVMDSTFEELISEYQEVDLLQVQFDRVTAAPDRVADGAWVSDAFTARASYFDGESLTVMDGLATLLPERTNGGAMDAQVHVATDGTRTPHPAGTNDLADSFVRLSDGTICGVRSDTGETQCISSAGAVTTGAVGLADDFGAAFLGRDDKVYVAHDGRVTVFDPATMATSSHDPTASSTVDAQPGDIATVHSLTEAPDGTVFAILTLQHVLYADHYILRLEASGLTVIDRPELRYFAYETLGDFAVGEQFFMFGNVDAFEARPSGYSWTAAPSFLRLAREGDSSRPINDFQSDGGDCVPIDDIESDVLTDRQRSVLEPFATQGPNAFICTTLNIPPSAELIDQNGRPVTGAKNFGDSKRFANLPPWQKYTIRDIVDGNSLEASFVTANVGQNLNFDLSGIEIPVDTSLENGYLGVMPETCVITSRTSEEWDQCAFHTAFDPVDGELLVDNSVDVFLIQPDASGRYGARTTVIGVGRRGAFTPDGTFVISDGDAWSVQTASAVPLPTNRDPTRDVVFALPAQPLAFFALNDGTGIVVRWNASGGTIDEVLTTMGALDATFAGDGRSVLVSEPSASGDVEVARYDVATGVRTLLYTSATQVPNIQASFTGNAFFGDNANLMNPTGFAFVEGVGGTWLGRSLIPWDEDVSLPMASNRYGSGALFLVAEMDNTIQGYGIDESAADPFGLFVPIPSLALPRFTYYPVLRTPAAFVVRTNPGIHVLSAADGSILHAFGDGEYKVEVRNDGKVAIQVFPCQDLDCRVLTILSEDQTTVVETIDNNDAPAGAAWPYGIDRARTDFAEGLAGVHWRHFEPIGLDMPCLLQQREDEIWCQ